MADVVAAQGSRLDRATLTVTIYPTCGEASIVKGTETGDTLAQLCAVKIAARNSIRGCAVDPERSEASSIARTRRTVRRWCVHHRATRLATLTFAEEPADLDAGWALIDSFRRRLETAGIDQPLIVPEWGSKGGRLHFHAAMPAYVPKDQLSKLWGNGFVDVRRLGKGNKLGGREQARIAAHYVAGYVAKLSQGSEGQSAPAGGPGPGFNRRRYSIPKGSVTPDPVRLVVDTMYDAYAAVQRLCGHPVQMVWSSSTLEDWRGPPTCLLMG